MALAPKIMDENGGIHIKNPGRNRIWTRMLKLTGGHGNPEGHTVDMKRRRTAAWILALLSPTIAELLSGSSPPLEFFNPIMFAGLLGMYGAGVLVVRELATSWGKGWASVLVLGVAYAIAEEGLACKSFFDPGWADLGDLATYGRFWSVNWVWTVWLVVYHAVISISLPILISQLLYPEFNRKRLLSERQFKVVFWMFWIDIAVFALAFGTNYLPPAAQYLLAVAAVVGLFAYARRVPDGLVSASHIFPSWKKGRIISPGLKTYATGFLFIFSSFLVASGSFTRCLNPVLTILLLFAIAAGTMLLLRHRLGVRENDLLKAYLAVGLLSFLILLSFILGFAAGVFGMGFVGIAFIAFSFYFVHAVRVRTGSPKNPSPGISK